jgi:hypothetical protein
MLFFHIHLLHLFYTTDWLSHFYANRLLCYTLYGLTLKFDPVLITFVILLRLSWVEQNTLISLSIKTTRMRCSFGDLGYQQPLAPLLETFLILYMILVVICLAFKVWILWKYLVMSIFGHMLYLNGPLLILFFKAFPQDLPILSFPHSISHLPWFLL